MNPSSTAMQVAVLGVGRMGKRHAQAYRRINEAQLVAVVDPDLERAETVADEVNCKAYPNVNAMLAAHPHVRAVSVAVPTKYHLISARPLLQAKIACLIEKPLAADSQEARELADLASRHDVVVQVGHSERFNPVVQAVAKMNLVPRFIEVDRVSTMTFRSLDIGVVMDLMIHDLDIVLMLANSPIKRVDATGVAVLSDHEDVANARLVFESGCVANLTASRLALKTERKLRVFSEDAYVSLNYQTHKGLLIRKSDNDAALRHVRDQLAAGQDLSELDYSQLLNIEELSMQREGEDAVTLELRSFLSAVRGERPAEVDAEAGCAAVDAAERVVKAIREHRWEGLPQARL